MNNNYELGKVIVALNINITSKDVLDYYIDLVLDGIDYEKAEIIFHSKNTESLNEGTNIVLIYLKDKNKNDYLLSNNQHASDFKKLQRGLDKITQQLGFKTTYKDLRNMYKEHCMKKCLDVNVVMELLGLQSMKLSLPQNYNSSDEEKIKQVNKL